MNRKQSQWRQGDVLIIKISDDVSHPTSKEIERDEGRVVLAYGEMTGHAHAISDMGCRLYVDDSSRISDTDAMGLISRTGGGIVEPPEPDRILVVEESVTLSHEEHDPIALDKGTFRIRRQREYDPVALRTVAD
jgi:hypothetical protein